MVCCCGTGAGAVVVMDRVVVVVVGELSHPANVADIRAIAKPALLRRAIDKDVFIFSFLDRKHGVK